MKLAFLSNVNFNMLSSFLPREHESYFSDGYDTIFQEFTDKNSGLYQFGPDVVFVLLSAEAAVEKYGAYFRKDFVQNLMDLIFAFAENAPNIKIFVSDLMLRREKIGPLMRQDEAEIGVTDWNYGLRHYHGQSKNLFVFSLQKMALQAKGEFFSDKLNYLGKVPFSITAQKMIAKQIGICVNALQKKRKKCLLLDLDNTLWGGVIGEDGLEGIRLANDGNGKPFYDAQLRIKDIKETGVILAVVSKNNLEDALLPFQKHPYCVLKENDFVEFKANWTEKAENIMQIAKELNIGLDSMVFLDDNVVEREKVKSALPQVAVVDYPTDVTALPQIIEDIYRQYFLIDILLEEDKDKTESYRIENMRVKVREGAKDIKTYIKELQIKIDLHPMREEELERVAQLTQKTNQFNLTTRRFTVETLRQYVSSPSNEVYVADVRDKYGAYGLVMVVMLRHEEFTVHIDNILMSCRVMGRDVENSVMRELAERQQAKGVKMWLGTYIRTEKNLPVRNLLENWGFSVTENNDVKTYRAEQITIDEALCEVVYAE